MYDVRVAVIADIHHGRDDETKLGSKALSLLDDALAAISGVNPDLLVDLGDRITDASVEEDKRLTREVAKRFIETELPRAHLLGNHDVESLDDAFIEEALASPVSHYSKNIGTWSLVFWQAAPHYRRGNLRIPESDLGWLADELRKCSYPTVIFTHVPLDCGAMDGNYYFEKAPEGRARHYNAETARRIIIESDSVVLVVSGHAHWNRLNTVDGVHFVTVQSLTETFTTYPEPAGAWADIRLGESIHVEVRGRDPIRLVLPIRGKEAHWLTRSAPEDVRTNSRPGV
ncbi:MAG: metallophosphoesterase family protein [Spirochaetota bacterium]